MSSFLESNGITPYQSQLIECRLSQVSLILSPVSHGFDSMSQQAFKCRRLMHVEQIRKKKTEVFV